jgi:uncharacterized protein (DUF2126 family)
VALLFRALLVRLLKPELRPTGLKPWGADLHDRQLLPSALWADLELLLADLEADGLPLDPQPLREIWDWRFPCLLQWGLGEAELEIRQALEPWPLLCDTPVEGGSTSRFVDSSLRRFEICANGALRQDYLLRLQGREIPWPSDPQRPVAVRYRQEALFPCLHPCLAPQVPLRLELLERSSAQPLAAWRLESESRGFEPLTGEVNLRPAPAATQGALQGEREHDCTLDLRLEMR